MTRAMRALVWEQCWKNRAVFGLWLVLLTLGAGLVEFIVGADPEVAWVRLARQVLVVTFLASVLVAFAPFTLMENQDGWRMNSMVTRWFILPVPTGLLVVVPYAAACLAAGGFLGLWLLLLRRLAPGLDLGHVLWVLMVGMAAVQALAWVVPRRPAQFWPLVGLGLPVMLLVALVPLDNPGTEGFRQGFRRAVPVLLLGFGIIAYGAARMNRCGRWSGELPLGRLFRAVAGGRLGMPATRSARWALIWSDVLPVWRTFLLTWAGVFLLVWGSQVWMLFRHPRWADAGWGMLMQIGLILVPVLGTLWLPVGGLLLGSEPGMGFRTRLTAFRSARPVTPGTLAAQRILAAIGLWLMVWGPWLILVPLHRHWHPGLAEADLPEIYARTSRLMAISAHALVGALPLFLWGRFEGFPNLLLGGMCAWAGTWVLVGFLAPGDEPSWRWALAIGLLALKFGVGGGALWIGWSRGCFSWRYALGLAVGWAGLVGVLIWVLPGWRTGGMWGAVGIAVLIPFARLAWAPLAVAANRHR